MLQSACCPLTSGPSCYLSPLLIESRSLSRQSSVQTIAANRRLHSLSPVVIVPLPFLDANQEDNMREQIEQALDKIRPALQRDGGDIELVEVEENGIVKVRLTGACGGCPMSQMTLKQGVERIVKQLVPEVKAVESV
jgi:Fe-S cluster biogenesis protein NfuA